MIHKLGKEMVGINRKQSFWRTYSKPKKLTNRDKKIMKILSAKIDQAMKEMLEKMEEI